MTVLSVALSGLTVAVRMASSPSVSSISDLSNQMEVTGMTFAATVTAHVAVLSPAFAVMTAMPALTACTLPSATVATDAFEEVQVTVLSVAFSGMTVAMSVASSPATRLSVVLSRVMEVTGMIFALTVMAHVADFSPAVAVMVTLPAFSAFTLPSVTVATVASDEVQVTVLSVALSGLTVAVRVASSPSVISNVVLFRVTEVTGTKAAVTVTVHLADLSPAFAVMTAVPALTAVTIPSSTVATDALEVVQVTAGSVALSGLTVAVRTAWSPSTRPSVVLSRVTEVTAMKDGRTVTVHLADLSPAFAVIVAVPALTAFTLPFVTVATEVFDEVQVTVLSVAFSGMTVAVRTASSPSVSSSSDLSNHIEVTGMTFAWTVTAHVAVLSPAFAVIVVVPALRAFTLPSVTVATDASEVVQVTVLSVASSGLTVAVRVVSSPSVRVNVVLSSVTEVTGMTLAWTVTAHWADFSPAAAVMVTFPGLRAFTLPPVTVATDASDVLQVTVLSVASSGLTVAVRVTSSPSVISSVFRSSSTEVTATVRCSTRMLQLSDLPPAIAVTRALPGLSALSRPLFTLTIDSSVVRQDTVFSVASAGLTVAVSVNSSPSIITRDVLFSSTEETGIVSSPQEWRAGNAVKKSNRRGNSFFIIGRLLSGHNRDCTKNTSLSPKKKENPYNFS